MVQVALSAPPLLMQTPGRHRGFSFLCMIIETFLNFLEPGKAYPSIIHHPHRVKSRHQILNTQGHQVISGNTCLRKLHHWHSLHIKYGGRDYTRRIQLYIE